VIETQKVNEKRPHLSGAEDKDFHLLRERGEYKVQSTEYNCYAACKQAFDSNPLVYLYLKTRLLFLGYEGYAACM
jgi:hypothetical protein